MATTTTTPVLVQSAQNSICRYQNRSCTATLGVPTSQGNLLVLVAIVGGGATNVAAPPGFVLVRTVAIKRVQLSMWYYQNAPSMSAANITVGDDRSVQVRIAEYKNASQNNALDQVVVRTDESSNCYTGQTNITAQADEIVIAAVAHPFASCSQGGFAGGLIRLFESLSPQSYYKGYSTYYNDDSDRTRFTFHHLIATIQTVFYLSCFLSSQREWVAILATFRGGSSGSKQMSSKNQGPVLSNPRGSANFTAFGAFTSGVTAPSAAMCTNPVGSAIIQPFNYQYWVGPQKLLIGSGSQYHVQSTDGLYGHTERTSDSDQPRDDGALRGVDLQSARIATFTMKVGKGRDLVELNMAALYRALVPQRDQDWPLIWRHPDAVAKMMYCRPIQLPRKRDNTQLSFADQTFALRAADPRHYSAVPKHIIIPNTPVGAASPTQIQVTNEGDIPAYPLITVVGPTSGPPVSRVTMTNATGLVLFDVQLTLPTKSVLVGDMQSRVTGSPNSVITLDGQSRYGAWQLPREPFRIDPDPTGRSGYNLISLQTVPAGAPVVCTLDYRDTWAG
jgi:hypothetical protein